MSEPECGLCKWWNGDHGICMYNFSEEIYADIEEYIEESDYCDPMDDCKIWTRAQRDGECWCGQGR
jgi:hypothetical protein